VNHKRTERLYRAEGLQVRTKKRRKLPRRDRVAAQVPERPMQRWSLDFMSDQLAGSVRARAKARRMSNILTYPAVTRS
jgi:putative transposase